MSAAEVDGVPVEHLLSDTGGRYTTNSLSDPVLSANLSHGIPIWESMVTNKFAMGIFASNFKKRP